MPVDDRPADYNSLYASADRAVQAADSKWKTRGKKGEFETNVAIVEDLTQRDPVRTKERLRTKLGQPVVSPIGDFYDTRIYPANLLDDGFEWPKFSFFHNEVSEYSKEESRRWGGSAEAGGLLWSAKVDHEGSTEYTQYETDISNIKIEFELLRAPIIRSWFSSYLLTGRGWKWSTSTPEDPSGGDPFSDGKIPPEQGNWPMIPTEAVFARNLTVKLDMSSKVNVNSLTETEDEH